MWALEPDHLGSSPTSEFTRHMDPGSISEPRFALIQNGNDSDTQLPGAVPPALQSGWHIALEEAKAQRVL